MKNLQKMGGIAALIGAATNPPGPCDVYNLGPQRLTVPTTQARSWLFLRTTKLSCAYMYEITIWSSA